MKCPVCNSTRIIRKIKDKKIIFICKKCGFVNKKNTPKYPLYL